MRFLRALTVVAAVCGLAACASADDLQPPSWRGQNLSVETHWEFDYLTPPLPDPMPADYSKAVGPPNSPPTIPYLHQQQPVAKIFNMNNMTYDPDLNGLGDGGWIAGPQDGYIDFSLPNWVDHEHVKWVYVQFSFVNLGGNAPPSIDLIEAFDQEVYPGQSYNGSKAGGGAIDDNHNYEYGLIMPNPDWEIIKIKLPANMGLYETVIDTISIPEPSTLLLGSLVTVGLLIMKKRERRKEGSSQPPGQRNC